MNNVRGPYDYERLRHRLGENPRPAQPNTSQPNQIAKIQGWGTNQEYFSEIFKQYLKRRKVGGM